MSGFENSTPTAPTPPSGVESEAGFTPGPWEQVAQHGAGPMIAHRYETGQQMNPTGLRLICHILQRGNSLPTDEANACLIAAAPELLDSCKRAIETLTASRHLLRKYLPDHHWMPEHEERIEGLKAAIAKAIGGHP